MAKVIYFTAGPLPTTQEKADIAAIVALAQAPFEVAVRNKAQSLGEGESLEAADFVAFVSGGSAPAPYDDTEDYPVFSMTEPPNSALADTMALVGNGYTVTGVTGAGANTVATITVANGVITAIACAAP